MNTKLIALLGEHEGREIAIESVEFVLGRDAGCQLRLASDRIDPRHCRIIHYDGRVLVEALGPVLGTEVNGLAVRSAEVGDGDVLQLGNERFEFAIGLASGRLRRDLGHRVARGARPATGLLAAESSSAQTRIEVANPKRPADPSRSGISVSPVAGPRSEPGSPPVLLRVLAGKTEGRAVEVRVPRFLIGRAPACHLRAYDLSISRLHASIERRDGRVYVRDQGSTNGTRLNGRLFQGDEVEAADGDRLTIGPLQFALAIPAGLAPSRVS